MRAIDALCIAMGSMNLAIFVGLSPHSTLCLLAGALNIFVGLWRYQVIT